MIVLDPTTGRTVEVPVPAQAPTRLEDRAAQKAARIREKLKARSRIAALVTETANTAKASI